MASVISSLDNFSSTILMKGELLDELNRHLANAVALTDVATNIDFSCCSASTAHNYFVALHDSIIGVQTSWDQIQAVKATSR